MERRTSIGRESNDEGIVFSFQRGGGGTMTGGEEDIISGMMKGHNI